MADNCSLEKSQSQLGRGSLVFEGTHGLAKLQNIRVNNTPSSGSQPREGGRGGGVGELRWD